MTQQCSSFSYATQPPTRCPQDAGHDGLHGIRNVLMWRDVVVSVPIAHVSSTPDELAAWDAALGVKS